MAKHRQKIRRNKNQAVVQAKKQNRIPQWGWYTVVGSVAIAMILGLFWIDSRGLRGGVNAARGIEGAKIFPEPGRGHRNGDISYAVPIPAGGAHNPVWQNCGIYDEPVRTENVLHSMEHGAVWIAYQPGLPEETIETLRNVVRSERSRFRNFYLLAPKEDAPAPIVATAWRAQLEVEDASDDRVAATYCCTNSPSRIGWWRCSRGHLGRYDSRTAARSVGARPCATEQHRPKPRESGAQRSG